MPLTHALRWLGARDVRWLRLLVNSKLAETGTSKTEVASMGGAPPLRIAIARAPF
jgi:hypothetical protein